MNNNSLIRKRFLAIVTCVISVLIGILYLVLITILDARGPMMPPPPEAFGAVAVGSLPCFEGVQQPY